LTSQSEPPRPFAAASCIRPPLPAPLFSSCPPLRRCSKPPRLTSSGEIGLLTTARVCSEFSFPFCSHRRVTSSQPSASYPRSCAFFSQQLSTHYLTTRMHCPLLFSSDPPLLHASQTILLTRHSPRYGARRLCGTDLPVVRFLSGLRARCERVHLTPTAVISSYVPPPFEVSPLPPLFFHALLNPPSSFYQGVFAVPWTDISRRTSRYIST